MQREEARQFGDSGRSIAYDPGAIVTEENSRGKENDGNKPVSVFVGNGAAQARLT